MSKSFRFDIFFTTESTELVNLCYNDKLTNFLNSVVSVYSSEAGG